MPEITPKGFLGAPKKNNSILMDYTINDILATLVGGVVISKLYNISIIKSVIGLFLLLSILRLVFGVNSEMISDLISEVEV